jgi:hypothetical protein
MQDAEKYAETAYAVVLKKRSQSTYTVLKNQRLRSVNYSLSCHFLQLNFMGIASTYQN